MILLQMMSTKDLVVQLVVRDSILWAIMSLMWHTGPIHIPCCRGLLGLAVFVVVIVEASKRQKRKKCHTECFL